jgi:hypothetical protein
MVLVSRIVPLLQILVKACLLFFRHWEKDGDVIDRDSLLKEVLGGATSKQMCLFLVFSGPVFFLQVSHSFCASPGMLIVTLSRIFFWFMFSITAANSVVFSWIR